MFLNRPFPLDIDSFSGKMFRYTFYASLCVFLILVLLQPFGIGQLGLPTRVLHAGYFAGVTFVSTFLNSLLLPRLLPRVYREEKWTVGKELVHMSWHLVPITFGNWLLMHFLYNWPLSARAFFIFLWITFVVGIFPLGLNVLLKQQRLLRKYRAGAARLEEQLQQQPVATAPAQPVPVTYTDTIVFTSESGKDQLQVAPGELRYVMAADNYIRICSIKDGVLVSQLLRSTLRKAAEQLAAYPNFFRCHRAYLVNLLAVEHVSGNAQGYKLHLNKVEELVPVSRNLNAQLTELLQENREMLNA